MKITTIDRESLYTSWTTEGISMNYERTPPPAPVPPPAFLGLTLHSSQIR